MSTTFAASTRTARPSTNAPPRRRNYTEQRRAARKAQGDRTLRAQLVKGRSLVNLAAAARANGSRWPFAVAFALIAGVSVIALLMLNTATAQTSFTERKLSEQLSQLSLSEQQLQQQVAAKQAPGELAKKAAQLGMQPGTNPGNLIINPDGTVTWIEPKTGSAPAPPAQSADPENPANPANDTPQQP